MQEKLAEFSKRVELLSLTESLYRRLNQYGLKLGEMESKIQNLASRSELENLARELESKLASNSSQIWDEISKLASKELLETSIKPLRELLKKQYDLVIGLKLEQESLREKLIQSDIKLGESARELRQDLAGLRSQLGELSSQLNSRLDWMENWIRRITLDPKGLESEHAAVNSEIDALKSKRDSGELSESEYRSMVKPLRDELHRIQNLLRPWQELDKLRSWISQDLEKNRDSIQKLESGLAELSSAQVQQRQALQDELKLLGSRVDQLSQSLRSLESNLDSKLRELDSKIKAHYEDLIRIQKHHEQRSSHLMEDILAKARSELDSEIQGFQQRLAAMDAKLISMEHRQNAALDQIAKLDLALEEIAKQGEFICGMSESLKHFARREELEPLLKTMEIQQRKLEDLDRKSSQAFKAPEIGSKLDDLSKSQNQILDQINTITGSLRNGLERLAGLESRLESLESKQKSLESQIQQPIIPKSLEERLGEALSEIQNLKRYQDELTRKLGEMENALSSLMAQSQELSRSLESRISEIQSRISEMSIPKPSMVERFRQLELRRRAALEETLELARAYHRAGIITDEELRKIMESSRSKQSQSEFQSTQERTQS